MVSNQTENKDAWYNRFWFTRNLAWLYVAIVSSYLDVKNFLIFRKEIKELARNPKSEFSQYGLQVNWLGNIIYTHKIMDADRVLYFNDQQKNSYLIENTRVEHEYLCDTLNWGEYLITRFLEFADENNNTSGYYGVEFQFAPISLFNFRIYRYLIFYIICFGLPIWICRHWILAAFTYLGSLL